MILYFKIKLSRFNMYLSLLSNELIQIIIENIGDNNNLFSTVNKNWYEIYTNKFTKKTYIQRCIISTESHFWSQKGLLICRFLANKYNLHWLKISHQNQSYTPYDNFLYVAGEATTNNNVDTLKYYCENIRNFTENDNDRLEDLDYLYMSALSNDNFNCFKYLIEKYINFIENHKIKEYYEICKEYYCNKSGDYLLKTYPNECVPKSNLKSF